MKDITVTISLTKMVGKVKYRSHTFFIFEDSSYCHSPFLSLYLKPLYHRIPTNNAKM
jgi:hypothetical protein